MNDVFVARLMVCRACDCHYIEGTAPPSFSVCLTGANGRHSFSLVLVVVPRP